MINFSAFRSLFYVLAVLLIVSYRPAFSSEITVHAENIDITEANELMNKINLQGCDEVSVVRHSTTQWLSVIGLREAQVVSSFLVSRESLKWLRVDFGEEANPQRLLFESSGDDFFQADIGEGGSLRRWMVGAVAGEDGSAVEGSVWYSITDTPAELVLKKTYRKKWRPIDSSVIVGDNSVRIFPKPQEAGSLEVRPGIDGGAKIEDSGTTNWIVED